jgi:hypothetical protein
MDIVDDSKGRLFVINDPYSKDIDLLFVMDSFVQGRNLLSVKLIVYR